MWWLTVGCERPDGSMQIAGAHLVGVGGGDEAQQAEADGIGQGGERPRQRFGRGLVERFGADGCATGDRIEHGSGLGHAPTVSTSVEEVH